MTRKRVIPGDIVFYEGETLEVLARDEIASYWLVKIIASDADDEIGQTRVLSSATISRFRLPQLPNL